MHRSFDVDHGFAQPLLGLRFDGGIKNESHAATGHATQHPESPEFVAVLIAALFNQYIGESIGCPRDNRLQRAFEVTCGDFTDAFHIAVTNRFDNIVQNLHRFGATGPFAFTT